MISDSRLNADPRSRIRLEIPEIFENINCQEKAYLEKEAKLRNSDFLNGESYDTAIEKITNLKTELYSFHIANGGKMVPFAGYDMPVQYSEGIIKEHQHVRSAAGIFDVSHMGQFSIFGNEKDYIALEQVVPIDLKSLRVNQSKYSVLMNAKGGIDDDLIITKSEEGINIVLNAACKHHDITRIHEVINPSITKLHDNLSLIAIQGPKAVDALEVLVKGVKDLKFMTGGKFKYKDNDVYVNRSGYTGEDGFEVSLENSVVKDFCKTLLENKEVKLIGLGARDSLRLEAGLCLYGHDLKPDISPIEASLSWALSKIKKGHVYLKLNLYLIKLLQSCK